MTETAAEVLRHTPLHDRHVALGARMVPYAGYEMPVQYGSIIEEHRTVRSTVGVFDLSHMGEVEVRGDEAVAFLRYALVGDPGALEIGQAQYSMLCEPDGGITVPGMLALMITSLLSRLGRQRVSMLLASQIGKDDLEFIADLAAAGRLTPVLDRSYPLAEAAEAVRYLEAGHARGKVIVVL